ncbi:MAG: glycosyltransferase family 2 protein [Rhodobacter sp.]|nr:glycosyltransferase family 2 protein [Rhodobacter sp.]
MAEPAVLRRSLGAARIGGLRVLEALCWRTPVGRALRVYFGTGVRPDKLAMGDGDGVRLDNLLTVGANVIATGRTADEVDGVVTVPFLSGSVEMAVTPPETALFEGLDTLLAQRHLEPVSVVTEWLAYHVAEHGLQAALIVDRGPPGAEREGFAQELTASVFSIAGLRRLVLVDASLPLGRPLRPALGDPATAPRAKTPKAEADPWRAPLGEPVLYDILKWRFLARAGAVIAIDPCELLRPAGDDPPVVQAVHMSHTGFLPLAGMGIYPWRVRNGKLPSLGDHICRSVPPAAVARRWGVAAKRCGPGHVWMPGMIAGLAAPQDEGAFYDRCMAAAFPRSEVAELVRKGDLVEDAELFRRATGPLKARPVRPPERPAPAAAVPAPAVAPSGRTAIVTCMKNEGPFILEWLAYHRMIGVDDVLVYTNDCTDGTDRLLDILQARGLVQRRDNPFRETGAKPQHAALAAARVEEAVARAGWIICMDVDEFINVHAGQGHLSDLYSAAGDANMISLTWRLFGNSDHDHFEDGLVTERFTRCAPQLIRRPHQAWGIKTLFQNLGYFRRLGIHRPLDVQREAIPNIRWVNGSGRPMPPTMLKTGWRSGIDSYGYDLVTLNHYSVRSAESYLVKRDRGRVNHVMRDQGEAYWFRMNNNAEEERSIQRHLPGLRDAVAALMADPEIAAAHADSVQAHEARIAALMADPDYRRLYDSLSSERMKKLSRMHRHFGMNVFLNGPGVIPDRVFAPDLPPDFFFNTAPPDGSAAD